MSQPARKAPTRQQKYRFVARKGSGAFADVIYAENVLTGEMVAIKRIKQVYRSLEEVQALREVYALRSLQRFPTIINLQEILYDRQSGRLALVCELMSCNLYEIIYKRQQPLNGRYICFYAFQILDGLKSMHSAGFFHRDVKPENILIRRVYQSYLTHYVKVADVGSCRPIGTSLPYTEYISTRWYRSPETLLSDGVYGAEMDIFGCGCVLFELTMLFPLFPGKDEADQIARIHAVFGTPTPELLRRLRSGAVNNPIRGEFAPVKGCGLYKVAKSIQGYMLDLLEKMLVYDPYRRITAQKCVAHPYFDDILDILADALDAGADEYYIRYLEKSWRTARGNDQRPMRHAAPKFKSPPAYHKGSYDVQGSLTPYINVKASQESVPVYQAPSLPHHMPEVKKTYKKQKLYVPAIEIGSQKLGASPPQAAYLPAPLPALAARFYKAGHKTGK